MLFYTYLSLSFCFIAVRFLHNVALVILGKKLLDLSLKSISPLKLGTFFSQMFSLKIGTVFSEIIVLGPLGSLLLTKPSYWPAYLFFFFALIITIFTDLEELVISRYFTLYLVPVGWALSMFKILPISPIESILGSIFGLILLYVVRAASRKFLYKEGLGQGDIDLLAFIGSFLGPFGCWISVMSGSLLACLIAVPYAIITKQRDFMIPFGVFLSLGAMIFILYQNQILAFFITP